MRLKTLIGISRSAGRNRILWKNRQELLSQIIQLHTDFQDSTDSMNSPEIITDSILQMSDSISLYQRSQIDEVEILNRMPESEVKHIESLKRIIERRNLEESKKEGSFVIELSENELYHLFSLDHWREKQLNKLV